jgi:hypothetical protein
MTSDTHKLRTHAIGDPVGGQAFYMPVSVGIPMTEGRVAVDTVQTRRNRSDVRANH